MFIRLAVFPRWKFQRGIRVFRADFRRGLYKCSGGFCHICWRGFGVNPLLSCPCQRSDITHHRLEICSRKKMQHNLLCDAELGAEFVSNTAVWTYPHFAWLLLEMKQGQESWLLEDWPLRPPVICYHLGKFCPPSWPNRAYKKGGS